MKDKFFIIILLAATLPVACAMRGGDHGAEVQGTDVGTADASGTFSEVGKSDRKLAKELSGRMEMPKIELSNDCDLIDYPGFTVMYSRKSRTPVWVAYELTAEETYGDATRERGFTPDPDYDGPQADDSDYRGSGWTRGHMAPAGDMKWSWNSMHASFYFTNICPQSERLNNGAWNSLEKRCREWAKEYGRVDIVCGPITLGGASGTIGHHRVKVSSHCFKAVLIPKGESYVCAGYLFTNDSSPVREIKTVDELEEITCIDFFPALPDRVENRIEAELDCRMFR